MQIGRAGILWNAMSSVTLVYAKNETTKNNDLIKNTAKIRPSLFGHKKCKLGLEALTETLHLRDQTDAKRQLSRVYMSNSHNHIISNQQH